MQYWTLLELVENDIASMDRDHLTRVRLLLQSDLWSAGAWLDDRKNMVPVPQTKRVPYVSPKDEL